MKIKNQSMACKSDLCPKHHKVRFSNFNYFQTPFLYKIFPEINRDEECTSYSEDFFYRRERLPSIVVEPTEQSECQREEFNEVEAEEYCSEDQTEASVDGEQRDKDRRMDEG